MISKKALNALLIGAVTLTAAGMARAEAQAHIQTGTEKEKCYGVVKAGKNDCAAASGSHSCAGSASVNGAGDEWVAVPKGLCEKLVNGSVTPVSTGAAPQVPDAAAPAAEAAPAEAPAEAH